MLKHLETQLAFEATFVAAGVYDLASAGSKEAVRAKVVAQTGTRFKLLIADASYSMSAVKDGQRWHLFVDGRSFAFDQTDPLFVQTEADAPSGGLTSPMPGKVVALLSKEGAKVEKGTPLMVLEAMKMELTISAPKAGTVKRYVYAVGEQVAEGAARELNDEATASEFRPVAPTTPTSRPPEVASAALADAGVNSLAAAPIRVAAHGLLQGE
jgi:3-methylcrotonyl-CoA carboxylase alpha subunit